jgi:uncharacterized protein YcbK (DUF882 family)
MLRGPVAAMLLGSALTVAEVALAAATDSPARTMHTVYDGQTLGKIARRYNVTVEDLCRANGLRHGAPIHPGLELVIPDGHEDDALPARKPGHSKDRWQDYVGRPRKRGVVTLQTPTSKWRGPVLTRRGQMLPHAREAVEKLFASWRTGTEHEIDLRLIQLVVRVSDTFGGRPVRVVSGYREHSFAVESKHKVGRAFDFSIPGVPNSALRDYLRTLPNVGVGYYPNSTHVHMDVREASAYWIDEAGPGEPPRYANHAGAAPPPVDTTDPAVPAEPDTSSAPAESADAR